MVTGGLYIPVRCHLKGLSTTPAYHGTSRSKLHIPEMQNMLPLVVEPVVGTSDLEMVIPVSREPRAAKRYYFTEVSQNNYSPA